MKRKVVEEGIFLPEMEGGVLHRVAEGERIILRDGQGIDRGAIISAEDLARLEEFERREAESARDGE